MTDERAKEELQELLDWYDSYNHPAPGNALKHALQAIDDRAALTKTLDAEFETVADVYKHTYGAVSAARRHMKGEP